MDRQSILEINRLKPPEAALRYKRLGWHPVPVPPLKKGCVEPAWQNLRIGEEEMSRYFHNKTNVGILTGLASGGLIDFDLDCAEAIEVAPFLFSPTLTSGRSNALKSHYWILADPMPNYWKAADLSGGTILEIRGDRHQTLVAPSIHPEGDVYRWENDLEPIRLEGKKIEQLAREVATAALLRHYWKKGSRNRHDLALAVAGFLGRRLPQERVRQIIMATAAGDEELGDRLRSLDDTLKKLNGGQPTTGAPTLDSLVPGLGQRLADWWGVSNPATGNLFAHNSLFAQSNHAPRHPFLASEAKHGLIGKFIEAVEPHSESDPVALAVNFLVVTGNVVGNGPHFKVEADCHGLRLNAVLVGETSKSRKVTSWGYSRQVFSVGDSGWAEKNIVNGLSSGEGLIWAVRNGAENEDNAGVMDKRLLVMEPELARVLKVMRREGNTLSAIIREAWDSGCLRVMTKNNPLLATDAHISIIGHITKQELLRYLDSTELANGFANRFLWIVSKRSKMLPEGGCPSDETLKNIGMELGRVLKFSSSVSEIGLDENARAMWHEVYPQLSGDKFGLYGAVVSRAEAIVRRLACIYALLDCSNIVKIEHLQAALALWNYAEESVRYIFGVKTGDSVADTILEKLHENEINGLAQTQIYNLFGRHQPAERIAGALSLLKNMGVIRLLERPTGGRPETIWKLAPQGCAKSALSEKSLTESSANHKK
ncbi:MAG: bifunctional DNA primase/polymerase [Elusimicrobia bacterium]|nr:bifunctional DNA primase/polymerase [Elusimicrobiota bacterium]